MDEQPQKILVAKWVFRGCFGFSLFTGALTYADKIPWVKTLYHDNPNLEESIIWLFMVASISSGFSLVVTTWWKMEPTLKILKEAIVQWATARATATSFEIINPADPSVFNDCFGSAVWILAYNPPLTLLEKSKDHRNVVYANLINAKFVYKMIVSRAGAERICVVLDRWQEEHGVY